MAQLKDLLVAGPSRFIGDMFGNTLQITKVLAPTTSGGSTYGAGSNNQVLRTNGTSIYWGSNVTSNEVYMNWSNPTTPNTDKQINLTVNGATAGTIKFVAGSNVTLTAAAGSPNTITIASSYTNSRDPGYGGIKVGANSTAVTAVTTQSSDVTLAAKTYNETYTFKPVNKWIMLQGTNSNTAGSDIINIGHALALTTGTAGTTYGQASAATPALGGGTFKVPNVSVDAAGHVTAVGEVTITMPSYTNSRDPGYGQIKVGANSSALTAVTAQSSDVTIQAASYNELFTFKPVNKWVMLQGTNSSTGGSDVINIGHALSAQTAGTFGSTDNQTPAHGATFNVPYLKTDAAGHITEAGTKTVTLPADNDHRDSGYGQIKVGANSSAVTAVTAQASDVTIQATTYNELFTFKPVNKWVMLQGTNSGTAGSDVINIGHTLSGVAKGTYGSTSAQTPAYGGTFTVPYVTVDEAGHVTGAGTATTKIPAAHNGYGGIKVVKNSTAVTAPTSLTADTTITAAAPNETFTFQPENKWVGLYASNSGTAGSDVIKIGHVLSSLAAGTYGSSSNQTPKYAATFDVPYLQTDAAGHVVAAAAKTVELPVVTGMNLLPQTQTLEGWGGTENRADTPFPWCFSHTIVGTTGNVDLAYNSVVTPKSNTWYTLSYWAKASAATTVRNYFYANTCVEGYNGQGRTFSSSSASDGAIDMDITTSWQKYWVSWKTGSSISGAKNIIIGRLMAKNGITFYAALPKLEEGKYVTDWTPNPGDGFHIYGRTGNTQTIYNGGASTAADFSLVLHGNSTTGSSGIAFVSGKGNTAINYPSDRAFIQYHPYGIANYAAEGTAPTLATSGEAARLVIGVGNDAADELLLQTPDRKGLKHQVGNTNYTIPDTNNTTGSVGSATNPVYVEGAIIKPTTYTLSATIKAGTSPYVAYYSGNNEISSAEATTSMIMPSHYYHTMYSNATTGTDVYVHYYNSSVTATNTNANFRVKKGSSYNVLKLAGGGEMTWDGGNISATAGYLKSTLNSNTVTIGSQNTSFTHIYNSANIPFIMNNSLLTTTGNLGNTSYPWNNLYIGKAGTKGIYYVGTKATTSMIRFLDNTTDANGNGVSIGGGGQLILGSGEAAGNLEAAITTNTGTETAYLLGDDAVYIEGGAQTIANRVGIKVDSSGNITPVKAEANQNLVQNIGADGVAFKGIYAGNIYLRRQNSTAYGRISFYQPTYRTWISYMSNSASGACPTGGQPSTTTEVSDWAQRSIIQNGTGYGWIWEAAAEAAAASATTKPTARMSLSSKTGQLRIEADASSSTNEKSGLIISSNLNGSKGNVALELWRGTNASWQIANEQGILYIRDNYTNAVQTTYLHDIVKISYNTGLIVNNGYAAGSGLQLNYSGTQYGKFYISALGTANSGNGNATQGAQGVTYLMLGNGTARPAAGTAGGANNARGVLRLYGTRANYNDLLTQDPTTSRNVWLPNTNTDADPVLVASHDLSGSQDLNTKVNAGIYCIKGGKVTNYPSGSTAYANLLVIPYRKPYGNTIPDYAFQIYSHANYNRLWFRGSNATAWAAWQEVAHITANTAVGSGTKGVYVTAAGVVTAMSYEVKSTINGGTQNRLAYYSGANAISAAGSLVSNGTYISRDAVSSSWYDSDTNSMIQQTSVSGLAAIMSLKTTGNHYWSIGHYDNAAYNTDLLFGFLHADDRKGATNQNNRWRYCVSLIPSATAASTRRAFVTAPYTRSNATDGTAAVGGTKKPIYINAQGVATECGTLVNYAFKTQTEYNGITTPDADTIYFIYESV